MITNIKKKYNTRKRNTRKRNTRRSNTRRSNTIKRNTIKRNTIKRNTRRSNTRRSNNRYRKTKRKIRRLKKGGGFGRSRKKTQMKKDLKPLCKYLKNKNPLGPVIKLNEKDLEQDEDGIWRPTSEFVNRIVNEYHIKNSEIEIKNLISEKQCNKLVEPLKEEKRQRCQNKTPLPKFMKKGQWWSPHICSRDSRLKKEYGDWGGWNKDKLECDLSKIGNPISIKILINKIKENIHNGLISYKYTKNENKYVLKYNGFDILTSLVSTKLLDKTFKTDANRGYYIINDDIYREGGDKEQSIDKLITKIDELVIPDNVLDVLLKYILNTKYTEYPVSISKDLGNEMEKRINKIMTDATNLSRETFNSTVIKCIINQTFTSIFVNVGNGEKVSIDTLLDNLDKNLPEYIFNPEYIIIKIQRIGLDFNFKRFIKIIHEDNTIKQFIVNEIYPVLVIQEDLSRKTLPLYIIHNITINLDDNFTAGSINGLDDNFTTTSTITISDERPEVST